VLSVTPADGGAARRLTLAPLNDAITGASARASGDRVTLTLEKKEVFAWVDLKKKA
jgi:hypothetical protein